VHAQARHHVRVELHAEVLLSAAAGFLDDHVGHDDVAVHVGKAPARAWLQPRDQGHRGTRALFAGAAGLRQAAHVALGQQVQRLSADGQRGLDHVGVALFVLVHRTQLQREAFGQAARAHARGFQALQQAQRHGELVQQFLALLGVFGSCQAVGQVLERVFEVAVVVQRFDQEVQRCAVGLLQAQGQGLAVQVLGQRFVLCHALEGFAAVVARGAGAAAGQQVLDAFCAPRAIGIVEAALALPICGNSIKFGSSPFLVCASSS